MKNEEKYQLEPVAPIVDDAEKGTLTCPKCGEKGQRANRHCCMSCGYPFSEERQCPVCGSLLSAEGLCEPCGKTYRRAEHERFGIVDSGEKKPSIQYKKPENKEAKAKSLEYLNILPAKVPMIISVFLSFIVLILFFVPMIRGGVFGESYVVLEMLDLEKAGFTALFSTWSALWPLLIALMGLLGAIFMPINNLISLLKKNPMRRGRILYDAIVEPFFVVLSIVVARTKVVPLVGKINTAGWICIWLCVAVLVLGIVSFILLKDNCEEVRKHIPFGKENVFKKLSSDRLLRDKGIWA